MKDPRALLALIATLAATNGVEQTTPGKRPPAALVDSFDGLGVGFEGPQGTAQMRNPSDNSLAVGPDHIVQTVNSRMAIFTKKGQRFETSGRPLYGPVNTNNVFRGFGGACEAKQRRRRRALRPAGGPLADRDADLPPRSGSPRAPDGGAERRSCRGERAGTAESAGCAGRARAA